MSVVQSFVTASEESGPGKVLTLWRWFANFGLSLAAIDDAVPAPEERASSCPVIRMVRTLERHL